MTGSLNTRAGFGYRDYSKPKLVTRGRTAPQLTSIAEQDVSG